MGRREGRRRDRSPGSKRRRCKCQHLWRVRLGQRRGRRLQGHERSSREQLGRRCRCRSPWLHRQSCPRRSRRYPRCSRGGARRHPQVLRRVPGRASQEEARPRPTSSPPSQRGKQRRQAVQERKGSDKGEQHRLHCRRRREGTTGA